MISRADITGLVLAGGRGSRMGGVDKGLQPFNGQPLALHTLRRLQPQVGQVLLNANRNLPTYQAFGQAHGAPVCTDELADYAGPLAGFLAGLAHCQTPYLATVPCDTPLLPSDLVPRLAAALVREGADMAMAAALSGDERDGGDGPGPHRQPVFCLLRADLRASLQAFTAAGGRKVGAWAGQHKVVLVPFDQPGDDPRAFFNANTLAELQALEQAQEQTAKQTVVQAQAAQPMPQAIGIP